MSNPNPREQTTMVLTHENPNFEGLLYPLMVIVAVAVVVFSLLGIASIGGWLPNALQTRDANALAIAPMSLHQSPFNCAECGVIESVQRVTSAEGLAP